MRNVVVSEDAESELRLVYDYLSAFGEQTAENFLGAYEKCVQTLEDGVVEFPLSWHPKLRAAGYHVAPVNSYLVLYRATVPDEVHIAHLFHSSQDYAKLVAKQA